MAPMANISGSLERDLDEIVERRLRRDATKTQAEAEKVSRDSDINTIKYEINCFRDRINKLEDKNKELSLITDTIMKELKIKDPVFQKELQQKVSKMIRKLKK